MTKYFIENMYEYVGVFLVALATTFFPRIAPINLASIISAQLLGIQSHVLFALLVSGGTVGTMILRYSYAYLGPKIKKYIEIKKEWQDEKKFDKKLSAKTSWLKRKSHLLHQKMHVVNKPLVLYLIVIINSFLPIPDLVVIMHVQKKVNVLIFFLCVLIGKSINYAPKVYMIKFAIQFI